MTTYTAGQQVVSPNNDVVSALAGFTSGAVYVPANWVQSGTYVPTTQTVNSAMGVPKIIREIAARTAPRRSGAKCSTPARSPRTLIRSTSSAWNAAKASGGGDPAEPAMYMGFEAGLLGHRVEPHVQVVHRDRASRQLGFFRPFHFTASRDANADLCASVSIDIGNSSSRAKSNLVGGTAGPLFTVVGTQAQFNVQPYVSALTGHSSPFLSATAGSRGRITWQDAGLAKWTLYSPNADPSLYLLDETNGKVIINMLPAAGANNGTMYVQTGMQVNGKVGFFATAPIAKRATTVDSTALASVITLANAIKADQRPT